MPSSILNSDDGVISGTSGLKNSGGDDGILVFQSKGTETARINTDKQIVAAAGTALLPSITATGDVNTGIFFSAADTLVVTTGGTAAVTVDAGQRTMFPTTIGVGGATPSTSGSGISFPASASASSNANTLDDYEEGTFTPDLTYATPGTLSVSYGGRAGAYTKIGNLVYFALLVILNNFTKGTASGQLRIAGLPFTATNPGGNEISCNWATFSAPLPTSAGDHISPVILSNNTVVHLSFFTNNSGATNWPDPDADAQYKLSGCYRI